MNNRQSRVVRVNAKRPQVPAIRVTYAPRPCSIDELADLVLELLEERTHSSTSSRTWCSNYLKSEPTPGEGEP